VGCVEDHFWQRLCRVLGLDGMAEDERYGSWVRRIELSREYKFRAGGAFSAK